ncbi:MAG: bacteriohemerythrin [Elusimicrobiota bacterium]|jgi:hemerythrin-like metal-binding protein
MPAFFPWKDDYSVGIPRLDIQHKQLIGAVNRLAQAVDDGHAHQSSLPDIFRDLSDYVHVHIRDEEQIMLTYSFPEVAAHQHEHQEFIRRLDNFQKGLREREKFLDIKVLEFLKTWLAKHMMVEDQRYAAYLKSKGIHFP